MKNQILIVSFVLALFLSGCNSSKKTDEVASYSYEEEKVEMSAELKAKMPDWVEEGKICYGLVVQITEDNVPVKGKAIKAKVVQIGEDAVKMKALETVSLMEVEGCSKMGISKGETWDENDGDFYLTREEAINRLKEMKVYKDSGKVTVD
ncbi:hypothetical protein OU798_02280 [Prolixibacteraceae bacterium Z1-6]|uniref:Lipoprotein n=1 Tax=Draconibacterium aestuarii TaxID=2998507 RepID=A0A9X3F246_9BACT|nr:hypothetical protein [Prolixibacteraceae bacterium Z1-6]